VGCSFVYLHQVHVHPSIFIHIFPAPKNCWFLVWMVSCDIFHKMLLCKGVIMCRGEILTVARWKQELECNIFFLEHSKYIYYNLVYVTRGCHGNSSYVNATSICWSICFHLGMWIMFHHLKSSQYMSILLPWGFETLVFCFWRISLWKKETKPCSLTMN
jgi:hypothetical protein